MHSHKQFMKYSQKGGRKAVTGHAPTKSSSAAKARILIVDDEATIRRTVTAYLTRVGYTVAAASNDGEALSMCEQQAFAVVLTDLKIPTMGGEALLERLKSCTPSPDVIITTAYSTVASAIRILKAGAYDYVLKPFQLADVGSVIHRCLERRKLQQDLDVERRLRAELLRFSLADRNAQEQDRRRIARDLHDGVAQLLVGVRMHIDLAEAALENALPVRPQLEQGRILLTQALQEIREVAWKLRPTVLDDVGLASALEDLTKNVAQRAAVQISLQLAADLPPLSAPVETALYRIAQEALSNSLQHAQASQISVQLQTCSDEIQLIISDNGCGLETTQEDISSPVDSFHKPHERRGLGLWNMRERTREIGGTYTLRSRPGQGVAICVTIPRSLAVATRELHE